jgi:hypothetical protein
MPSAVIRIMAQTSPGEVFDVLARGPMHWFRGWPDTSVPSFGAGIYTIWDGEGRFVYVGMSGRGITRDSAIRKKPHGLLTRLRSHARGRRSGDQFCVYVADRFVLSALSPEDIAGIASGRHSIDAYVRQYIHKNFGYRYWLCRDGVEATVVERQIRRC